MLPISGVYLLVFLGHVGFSFASNLAGDDPNLSISIPDNSIIMTPTVPVSGTVTSNLEILSMTWNVDNGHATPILGFIKGTSFTWSFDISHLSNGLHTIQINTTNSAGVVFSKVVSFTLYTDSPVPTASLPNGTYNGFQTVKLETSDPALIFYTLDGTTPTLSSAHGEDSITLPEIKSNTILKFFAVDAYGVKSNVNTQIYIINGAASLPSLITSASNTKASTPQMPITSSDNQTVSSVTTPSTHIVLPKTNTVSSTIVIAQNMTTVNLNSTIPEVESNGTASSTSVITQNMTMNINSTLSTKVQSNNAISSMQMIIQNMTTTNTNSTLSTQVQSNNTANTMEIPENMTLANTNSTILVTNQTNDTVNILVNGTR